MNISLDKIRKYGENIRKTEIRSFITLTPGQYIFSVFPQNGKQIFGKILKYGENIFKTEIWSFITFVPGDNIIKLRISVLRAFYPFFHKTEKSFYLRNLEYEKTEIKYENKEKNTKI